MRTSLLGGAVRALVAAAGNTRVPYVPDNVRAPARASDKVAGYLSAYGAVGTLFAIVNRTSNAASLVDWKLWRKAASGRDEDRVEVTSHAALDMWDQPNAFMPRQEFVEGFSQHIDLVGEGWWVMAWSSSPLRPPSPVNFPLTMFYVRPDRIAPVPHATRFLAGYVYYGPEGEKIPLELREVIQLKMPNPVDIYRGMGPVQAALVDIEASAAAAEWNRNFFRNDATPGGIIKVDKRLDDDEWREMTYRWREQHQGVGNAHRVAVLEQGEWVDRKFTMRDMQFRELRDVGRELVREAFGFPKPMLGTVDDVNRANAEAAEVVFSRWLMVPRLERIKGALNRRLLPHFGETATDLEFDYEDPTPPDAEAENAERDSKIAAVVALIAQGFDALECMAAFGLPEIPWTKPEAPPAQGGFGAPPAVGARAGQLALPAAHRHRPRGQDEAEARQAQLEAVQRDYEQVLDRLLGDWETIKADVLDQLYVQVAAAVEDDDTEALAALAVESPLGVEIVASAMRQMAAMAAQRIADEAAQQGVTIDPAPVPVEMIETFSAATVGLVLAGLAGSAGREALRVRTPGASAAEVASQVREFLAGQAMVAAKDMLGGALTNAQNTARIDTLRLAPTAAYYADETLDKNTCDPCKAVDGKWLGNDLASVEDVYPNGGYRDCRGRERCRGTVVAVWRPEQVGE